MDFNLTVLEPHIHTGDGDTEPVKPETTATESELLAPETRTDGDFRQTLFHVGALGGTLLGGIVAARYVYERRKQQVVIEYDPAEELD